MPSRSGPPGLGKGSRELAYRSRFADPLVDRLFQAILVLRTPEDCYRLFEDLCTVGEVRALAQRFHVAELLASGATYDEISAATHMSSATISRIKRFLQDGADGYRLVLERLGLEGCGGPSPPEAGGGHTKRPPVRGGDDGHG